MLFSNNHPFLYILNARTFVLIFYHWKGINSRNNIFQKYSKNKHRVVKIYILDDPFTLKSDKSSFDIAPVMLEKKM